MKVFAGVAGLFMLLAMPMKAQAPGTAEVYAQIRA
jgi:hypothetical protein